MPLGKSGSGAILPLLKPSSPRLDPRTWAAPDRLAALGHLFGLAVVVPGRVVSLGPEDVPRIALAAPELPSCDYLVAHEVVSWLPPASRAGFFRACATALRPGGVLALSFDTYPGATDFEPLRELMRYHVANVADPARAVRDARGIARWHVERVARLYTEVRVSTMRRDLEAIEAADDADVLHMLRAPDYHPLLIEELARELDAAGLRWLCNARPEEPRALDLPGRLREMARVGTVVERQQYLDFFAMTRYRTSLACRADAPIAREVGADVFLPLALTLAPRAPRLEMPVEPTLADVLRETLASYSPDPIPVRDLVAPYPLEPALAAIGELWSTGEIDVSMA